MSTSSPAPQIVASQADWVVVNKPAGWLTIAPANPEGDRQPPILKDWVCAAVGRVEVVHRIDRGTSGLVLFARSQDAHRRLSQWFQNREVRKRYECLALGDPGAPMFKLQEPIRGLASVTQVEVKERYGVDAFLASVRITTGRRHQIRIHLSERGNPILGDRRYGGPTALRRGERDLAFTRPALHASQLELPTGERFEAPWPEDFSAWVKALRGGDEGV